MILSARPKLYDLLPLILGPILATLIWVSPVDMAYEAKLCGGIILWVASWWLCSLIPLHVSVLVGLVMAHFFNLAPWPELLRPFSDPIIFLFMGGFFLAQAVQYHGLDQWMVQATLANKHISGNSHRLFLALIIITMMMSGFLSNTATTALVVPIGIEILRRNQLDLAAHSKLLLLLAAAASIGGTITPVGSPPNMIALGLMKKITGTRPDFATWVVHMVPLSFAVMAGMLGIYWKDLKKLPKEHGIKSVKTPITTNQLLVAAILIITATLWALPSLISLVAPANISAFIMRIFPESVVAVCAGIMLMLTPTSDGPLLPWPEAQKIDWGILLLFGGGMSLGELAFSTGLVQIIAQQIDSFSGLSPAILLIIAIIGTTFITELVSNTATANLIIPILLASPVFLANSQQTIFAIVAAANLAFMLPVGTPPNAIVYSTGLIKLSTMIKRGILANIMSILIIISISLLFF